MKNTRYNYSIISLLSAFIILITASCKRDEFDDLEPATSPETAEVFIDGFSAGLQYAAFGGSKVTAFEVDEEIAFEGSASMRFSVPDAGDPDGAYAGGAYITESGRDLSGYNVLTFWARASKAATIDVVGFGNDLAESTFQTTLFNVPVNTNWKKYYIPLPDPSVLTEERGMFFFSEGPELGEGYTFWIDELKFEDLGTVAHKEPSILNGEDVETTEETGAKPVIDGLIVTFNLPTGVDQSVSPSKNYFSFESSNTSSATVDAEGNVSVLDAGTAVITGKLGDTDATGSLTIVSTGAPIVPLTKAPVPAIPEEDVVSLYSNAYTDQPVDFYNGFWEFSTTLSFDIKVEEDDIIRYTNLNFVGIQFTTPTIDVSAQNHFHMDIWTPDPTAAADFKILLVDLGADGSFGGDDDKNHEVVISNPTLVSENWISLDIPLSDFTGLTTRSNLAQIVLSSATISNVFADNIYFYYEEPVVNAIPPTAPAAAPTQDAANVISVFSDAYTDVAKDGFNLYGAAAFEEVQIAGDASLKYTFVEGDGGNFQVIELGGANQIDAMAAGMTNFKFDIWFPNEVNETSSFLMKVVDFAGGNASEGQINFNSSSTPAIAQGSWISLDIPLADLMSGGLAATTNIQQIVIDLLTSGEVYIDNIYFYKEGGSTGPVVPTMPAAAPTEAAANVISIYSDAYTDVAKDGFNFYGAAAFEEVQIAGNGSLKYTFVEGDGGNFQVIELGGANQINASAAGMTNFRFDIWFPTEVTESSSFLMKMVDFAGGASSEGQISISPSSNPAMTQGNWISFDILLSDLMSGGLAATTNIQQIVIDLLTSNEAYLDNIYFYKEGGSTGPVAPTMPPATPTEAAADVISIYSDAYTDVGKDGFNLYGAAAFEEVMLAGNGALKYTFVEGGGGNFQVIELGGANQINAEAAGMTNFRFDLWFPNDLDEASAFLLKVVDIPGAASEGVINISPSSNPAMTQGNWISFDVPFTELMSNGLGAKSNIQQVVIDLLTSGEVYMDNLYFYKGEGGGGGGGGGGGDEPTLPLDFENGEAPVLAFDNGAFAANADNPDTNGNTSAKVLQFNKTVGSAWYSGVVFDEALRTTPIIDLANGTVFTIKIWSPNAGISVRFQLEGGSPDPATTPAYEVFQTVNTANEWVTLTFDFTSQADAADSYNRFSIFPDFDASNQADVAVESIYYFDDITQQ